MTDTSAIIAAMTAIQGEAEAAEHGINSEEWERLSYTPRSPGPIWSNSASIR